MVQVVDSGTMVVERVHKRIDLDVYQPWGGVRQLWNPHIVAPEILLDGPAGTGKTRGCGEWAVDELRSSRGLRIGYFRKTRESMNETVLNSLEQFVLGSVHDPALTAKERRNRKSYLFPETGGQLILAGFDDIQKLFSLELTHGIIEEAIEVTQTEATALWRGLRYRPEGYTRPHRLVYATNPGPEDSWLNWRCTDLDPAGRALRLVSRHEDNPRITDEFLANLRDNMHGEMRERMYEGKWVAAQGRIVGTFGRHNILSGLMDEGALPDLRVERLEDRWWLVLAPDAPVGIIRDETRQKWVEIALWGASIDWGPEKPGTVQLWAIDRDDRHYLVAEVYETRMPSEKYAETIAHWHDAFGLFAVVYDAASPDHARLIESHLARRFKVVAGLLHPSPKEFGPSVDEIRRRFARDARGVPRAFVLDNSLLAADPVLQAERKPLCLQAELRTLRWATTKALGELREVPEPTCADHGFDAARYWFLWNWYRVRGKKATAKVFAPNTLGKVLGHDRTTNRGRT